MQCYICIYLVPGVADAPFTENVVQQNINILRPSTWMVRYQPTSPKISYSEGPLFRRSDVYGRGYNFLRFMDRIGSGGSVGHLGFRVGVSASYRYITSFGKLIHKLRYTSFGILDLRNSGPESDGKQPMEQLYVHLYGWKILFMECNRVVD